MNFVFAEGSLSAKSEQPERIAVRQAEKNAKKEKTVKKKIFPAEVFLKVFTYMLYGKNQKKIKKTGKNR